jgi:uncharacterized coiled-coil protein SlyX
VVDQNESWHLDKKVPVAIIATLMLQIIGFGWIFGALENRVTQLERRANVQSEILRDLPEKMGRLDEQMKAVRATVERIDRKLAEGGR